MKIESGVNELVASIRAHVAQSLTELNEFVCGAGRLALENVQAQLKALGEPTRNFSDEMVEKVIAFIKTDTGKRLITLSAGVAAVGVTGGAVGILLANRGLIQIVVGLICGIVAQQVTEEMVEKCIARLEEEAEVEVGSAEPAGAM